MSSAPDSSPILPIASLFSRPDTPIFDFEQDHPVRPCSPVSSIGSHASGISHPPGERKRRRITLADVSSDVLLNSIDDWDDGRESRQSLAGTSSEDLAFSAFSFPIQSFSPPRSPGIVSPEWSGSREGPWQTASELAAIDWSQDIHRQKSHDGSKLQNPRDHPYYALPTQNDGKYYCPFARREKPCNHPPTTQKWAYHKYLDSHLKPYRCKVPACVYARLCFSSHATLFRHEREAHGLHGHGDNPHLCHFEGCDRSVPGSGFPRRWNLYDHMRRMHDYDSSERHSLPETSPPGKRKRRVVTGAIPAPTMKRTRSMHSQASPIRGKRAFDSFQGSVVTP